MLLGSLLLLYCVLKHFCACKQSSKRKSPESRPKEFLFPTINTAHALPEVPGEIYTLRSVSRRAVATAVVGLFSITLPCVA